ncbi:transcription initiation factor IIB family protein [Halorientalis brevis]|uniref:Transcription initiation factor IIB family protein n=1 Tax=Halorientalis brevis TaxID=1126241 RepID=A0ABD6CAG4_9EURY|nr:transcription initiation factor IIB family protein [Halorientalis brevis]
MSSNIEISEEASAAQAVDNHTDEQTTHTECPACSSRVIADDVETFCRDCGLVVRRDDLARTPTPSVHGPTRVSGPQEWAIEPTTAFRVDNGLGSRMDLGMDGNGNPLSTDRRRRLGRMRTFHQRLADRERRLADALRDVENISTNADLPRWVGEDAARYMRRADAEWLAGGRMAWESLACGAVLLATRAAGFEREPERIAHYAKTSHERACAAARKIRTECGLVGQVPPVRPAVVDAVLAGLDDELATETVLAYARLGRYLMGIADAEPIGPGTTRVTVAASAVYAADRLTDGKALTQAAVVAAGSRVCPTTTTRVSRYSRALHDAYRARHGQVAPATVLERATDGGRLR